MKALHWLTISNRAWNPVPYWNESSEDWNWTQRWRPLENTELSKSCPQNVFIKSLDELWPSRISRLVPSLQIYAKKRDVILNLTKFPSGTVIIQVHFMLRGNVCGYSGEKSLPVSPVKGMTLSIPCVLHGPMVAEMKNKNTFTWCIQNVYVSYWKFLISNFISMQIRQITWFMHINWKPR